MVRATDRFLSAWINLPDLEQRKLRLSDQEASRSSSSPPWLVTDRFAAEAQRPSVIGWDASNDLPNCLDPAYPQKTALAFPPEFILGGFSFLVTSLHELARSAQNQGHRQRAMGSDQVV